MIIQLEIPKELEEDYLFDKCVSIFESLGSILEQGIAEDSDYDVLEMMADAFKKSRKIC